MFAQLPCCYFIFFRCSAFLNLAQASRRFIIIQYFCPTCYNTCHVVNNVCQMFRTAALALFKDVILIPSLLKTVQLCVNCIWQDFISLLQNTMDLFFLRKYINYLFYTFMTSYWTSYFKLGNYWRMASCNEEQIPFNLVTNKETRVTFFQNAREDYKCRELEKVEWESSLKQDSFCPIMWQVSGRRTITRKNSAFSSGIFCRYAGPWQHLYIEVCSEISHDRFSGFVSCGCPFETSKNHVPCDKRVLPDRWTVSKAGSLWMFLGSRQSTLILHLYPWNHRQKCVSSCTSHIVTKGNCISTAPGNKFR